MLVKRSPPAGKKLLVIGTSSAGEVLESMGLAEAFNVTLHVPALRAEEIVRVLRESDAFRCAVVVVVVAGGGGWWVVVVVVWWWWRWRRWRWWMMLGRDGAGVCGGARAAPGRRPQV